MKRLIFILFACIPVLICAQGLRRSVCAVSPCYSSEESAALRQYALWLSRNGRPDDSRFILSTLQPDWHGSGVVVRREGRLCVLTQRYVTGYARTADVVFYLHDRTVSLKACAVLGTDGSTLCLVQLPDMAFFAALEVSDTAPDEGDDIAAAVDRFPENVAHTSEHSVSDGDADRRAGVIGQHAPGKAVCRLHE